MVSSRTTAIDDRNVRVWRGGSGRPVVLLQGGCADAEFHWKPVWNALAESCEVIAPDWPGFGQSEPLPTNTWLAMTDWIAAFLEGVDRPVLIGNSFGGTLARLLAVRFPHLLRGVAIVDGGQVIQPSAVTKLVLRTPLLLRWMASRSYNAKQLANLFARPSELSNDDLLQLKHSTLTIFSILREAVGSPVPEGPIQVPGLVIWGGEDRHSPPEAGETLARDLGLPFRVVPRAGHLPMRENPNGFVQALADFL
jgi:pimeloyl-ACP methyl ester carboxylesterase